MVTVDKTKPEQLDAILKQEPDSVTSFITVMAAYATVYGFAQHEIIEWSEQLDCWHIFNEKTETNCQIEYHGISRGGYLKFRMFNSLFKHKKWHTVLLPVNIYIHEEDKSND